MTVLDRRPFDDLAAAAAADQHCPTIAWGVVFDGELALDGDVGDVDPDTVFRIASMTKSFSAAATLALRDEGVLALDDPVGRHAPELAALRSRTDDAPEITVRDLLTMTSGLVTDDPWADRHLDLTDDEFDAIVAAGAVFAEPTGTAHEYSNFGFALLGRVLHRATGVRIQEHVNERLLAPLGLTATTWEAPGRGRWARPMRWLDDRFVDELAPLGDGLIAPMGGLWTTVRDVARWVAWLDDAFPARDGGDEGPLRRSSRREMQSPQSWVGERTIRGVRAPMSYGYGLRVSHEPSLGTVVGHSGGFPGYGSAMRWLPGRRIGAIALANVTYAPMTELTARMLDELDRQGVVPGPDRPLTAAVELAARRLLALLDDWDDVAADDLFADNVAPDDAYERRRAAAARLAPIALDRIEAINDARGRIHGRAATGAGVTITFSLATHDHRRIQAYDIGRRMPGVPTRRE